MEYKEFKAIFAKDRKLTLKQDHYLREVFQSARKELDNADINFFIKAVNLCLDNIYQNRN